MSRPMPRPGVLDIAPYVPGKSSAPGVAKVFKLSANETPLGPSPKAIEAYKACAAHLEDYPEGSSRVLREAIGKSFGLDPDRIICGAGSRRDSELPRPRLSRRRRRSDHDRALLSGLSDRDDGERRQVRRRARDRFHRKRRCDPRRRHAAHENRLDRQPEQSDRHLPAVRRGEAAAAQPAAACVAGHRRGLFANTCRATTTRRASNWWRPPRTR